MVKFSEVRGFSTVQAPEWLAVTPLSIALLGRDICLAGKGLFVCFASMV